MIIYRYLFKEFIPPFCICVIFFSFIFVMTQLPQITKYVVNLQIGISTVILLLLYSTPYFLQFTIPMAVMIAVLLTFLRMSGDMEVVALKAGGVHIYRLLPPVITFGLLCALLTAGVAIYAQPLGTRQSRLMLYHMVAAHADIGLKAGQFTDLNRNVIIYIQRIDNATKTLSDIFIEDRRSPKLHLTVVAPRGQLSYDPGQETANLRLFNGTIYQVDLAKQRATSIAFETYDLRLDMGSKLRALKSSNGDVQEMSLSKLRRTIRSARQKNGIYYKALQEWYKKFSLPAACLVMALLAMPLGIRARSSQRAYGLGLGVFFFLLYYIMLSVGWVMGQSGAYPPVIGMWLPNAVILGIALILLVRAADEKPLLMPAMPNWMKRLRLRNAMNVPWKQ